MEIAIFFGRDMISNLDPYQQKIVYVGSYCGGGFFFSSLETSAYLKIISCGINKWVT